jgi:hypothetical protein
MNPVPISNAKSMRPLIYLTDIFFPDNNPSMSSEFNTVLYNGFSQQCKSEQLTKSIDDCLQCSERKKTKAFPTMSETFHFKN